MGNESQESWTYALEIKILQNRFSVREDFLRPSHGKNNTVVSRKQRRVDHQGRATPTTLKSGTIKGMGQKGLIYLLRRPGMVHSRNFQKSCSNPH